MLVYAPQAQILAEIQFLFSYPLSRMSPITECAASTELLLPFIAFRLYWFFGDFVAPGAAGDKYESP